MPTPWTPDPIVDSVDGHDSVVDGLCGTSATDVWLLASVGKLQKRIVLHWDGHGWLPVEPPVRATRALWCAAPDDVWAVGRAGTYAHFDGKIWTPGEIPDVPLDLVAVAGFGDHVVVATAQAWIFAFDGTTWVKHAPAELAGAGVTKLGQAGNSVWMPVNRLDQPISLVRFDGQGFTAAPVGAGADAGVKIATAGPNDVWMLSPKRTYRWDGQVWTALEVPRAPLYDLSVSSKRALTVGDHGIALIWDGARWRESDTGTDELLRAAYVAPDGSAWIAGRRVYRGKLP